MWCGVVKEMHKLLGAGVSAEVLLSPPTVETKLSMEKVQRNALPPGVTERDLEMFRRAQEKASQVSTRDGTRFQSQ